MKNIFFFYIYQIATLINIFKVRWLIHLYHHNKLKNNNNNIKHKNNKYLLWFINSYCFKIYFQSNPCYCIICWYLAILTSLAFIISSILCNFYSKICYILIFIPQLFLLIHILFTLFTNHLTQEVMEDQQFLLNFSYLLNTSVKIVP